MRTLLLPILLTLAATGCMSNTKSSDSALTHSYDCSGLAKGWGDCTQKADAECGANNYTVMSRNGEADDKGNGGNSEMKRTMVVSCRH
jgi:hypothetical protein